MDKIKKALVFGDEISVTFLETTQLVNRAIEIHSLSPLAAAALGRTMTCVAFMASCLKNDDGAVSVSIKGDGVGGSICVSGNSQLHIRGYIDNPHAELLPNAKGKLDVGGCVGRGSFTVIREDGDALPFVGTCELTSGEIAEDFAMYFAKSEQIPTAIAVGVKIDTNGRCIGAGGVVAQPLPFASEDSVIKTEEVFSHLSDVSSQIEKEGIDGVIEKYFGNIECRESKVEYHCNCSKRYIESIIVAMGERELRSIIEDEGKISVHCHYCNTDYNFYSQDVDELFKAVNNGEKADNQ